MSNILSTILLVVLPIIAFFLYRRIRGEGRKNNISVSNNDVTQANSSTKKHPKDKKMSLTLEERVELSWQFLVNITDKILNKFSKEDVDRVYDAGQKMNKHGVSYQHDVKKESKVTMDIITSRVRDREEGAGRSR